MSNTATRAQRFPVHIAVAFRERGGKSGWAEGRSVNVSRTGVLFETDQSPGVGTPLEIILEFSPPLAKVRCSGRVVRASPGERSPWAIGATIARYRLVPATHLPRPEP